VTTSQVFGSPADVPDRATAGRLRISGLSLVTYYLHRFDGPVELDMSRVRASDEAYEALSYEEKLAADATVRYTTLVGAGRPSDALTRALPGAAGATLRQSAIGFDGDYVMSVVPYVVSVARPEPTDHLPIDRPLDVDACLDLIAVVTGAEETALRCRELGRTLLASGLLRGNEPVRTEPMRGFAGLQVWDITGTEGRDPTLRYRGLADTRTYAWDLSAIMAYGSDHVIRDRLWRERNRDQVYADLQSGSSFFEDHMVFLNGNCCVEVAHIPAWLRDRSLFRLSRYGYDSSSIFVASVSATRHATLRDLARRYSERVRTLADPGHDMSAGEPDDNARTQVRDSVLIDAMRGFRPSLREARNRALDESLANLLGTEELDQGVVRDIGRTNSLVERLVHARQAAQQARTSLLLGAVAVALAVVGVPDLVEQVAQWIDGGRWIPLGVSSGLSLAVLLIIVAIYRAR
jgi:hypothetical protein